MSEIIENKGGFTIFMSNGHCLQGHFWQPNDTPDEKIGFMVINYVSKMCQEYGETVEHTMKQIESNLKMNNIKIK